MALKENRFVNTIDILRCESSNNYTTFFHKGGDKILVSKPIYEYEEILNDYGNITLQKEIEVSDKKYRISLDSIKRLSVNQID